MSEYMQSRNVRTIKSVFFRSRMNRKYVKQIIHSHVQINGNQHTKNAKAC